MRFAALFLFAVLSVAAARYTSYADEAEEKILNDIFNNFKIKYNKQYKNAMEEEYRRNIFFHNHRHYARHNNNYFIGKTSYYVAPNEHSDKLAQEHTYSKGLDLSLKKNTTVGATFFKLIDEIEIPDSIDWNEKGAVTPVKDQGQCGSCWAFSTTGSLEGQMFRKTGKLVSLSEQNLVDCSSNDNGCNGGLMDNAFTDIKSEGGIDSEDFYPYTAQDGQCKFDESKVVADDKGFVDIPKTDEEALKQAVATIGPISVAIDASDDGFMNYAGGIYDANGNCSPDNLDHGVLVTGYGTKTQEDGTTVDYWIVKNSWGASWGANGYIYMKRNNDNMCGIASMASYPLV